MSEAPWAVSQGPNRQLWRWLGEELPMVRSRHTSGSVDHEERPRDPYWEQGSHPDVVDRIWNQLGRTLPRSCRAQAKGRPVLAESTSGRIFAVARGTAYALWLTKDDFGRASDAGASTKMVWSGSHVTDLAKVAGEGWIWGKWYSDEVHWLWHSFDALVDDAKIRPP